MKKSRFYVAGVLVTAVLLAQNAALLAQGLSPFPDPPAGNYSYQRAIKGGQTTSPTFVQITAVNSDTGEEHSACVSSNFLFGAVMRQNALPQNAAGYRVALEIALANAEHRFVFGAAAWQILPQPLPFAETIALRQRLSMFSTARLQAGFLMSPWGPLHALFRDHHTYSTIACVLIEHGLAPYVDDFGGELGVSPSEDASAF